MIIEENTHLNELINIFDNNNQGYIQDKNCLLDDKYLKIVAVSNNIAIGYAVIYFGHDFIDKEKFDIDYTPLTPTAYIWNCATKLGHENQGVMTQIFQYLTKRLSKYNIYSVVSPTNIPSLKVHTNNNFIPIKDFFFRNELYKFMLYKKN